MNGTSNTTSDQAAFRDRLTANAPSQDTPRQRLAPAGMPDVLELGNDGRCYMLGWLSSVIEHRDNIITVEDWREAYGRAADYQTASAARTVLRQAVS